MPLLSSLVAVLLLDLRLQFCQSTRILLRSGSIASLLGPPQPLGRLFFPASVAHLFHDSFLELVEVILGHEKEVDKDVEEDGNDEADAQVAAGLRLGHKVTEAHQVVHEEDARALVENLHLIREDGLHRPEVRQVDDHEDGEEILDGQLHPKELGDDDHREAEARPANHKDNGINDGQPLA